MKKEEITRKEAVKKIGRYAALTALGTFTVLSPLKSQAGSCNNQNGVGNDKGNCNGHDNNSSTSF